MTPSTFAVPAEAKAQAVQHYPCLFDNFALARGVLCGFGKLSTEQPDKTQILQRCAALIQAYDPHSYAYYERQANPKVSMSQV